MGVAVGRATSTAGLRALNYNNVAANKQHLDIVYQFYDEHFNDFLPDLSCCKDTLVHITEPVVSLPSQCTSPNHHPSHLDVVVVDDLPSLESPWDLNEFINENKSATFLSDLSDDFFRSNHLKCHVDFLYYNVDTIVSENLKTSQHWINAYKKLNTFILSDQHILSIRKLFQVSGVNNIQNKFSTKLVFWLMDKEVDKQAKKVMLKQTAETEAVTDHPVELISSSKSKIRYLAGACVHKIAKRLRESVLRKMGQCTKRSKLSIKLDYKKQALLKQFRINEQDLSDNDESMAEINFKQGQSRGLTIVSDIVFDFFLALNAVVQQKLSPEQIDLHFEELHHKCRYAVDNDDVLLERWIALFEIQNDDEIEDELFLTLIMELYKDITEHFIRIAFVDSLKNFKRSVPRKKKQALRTKIQALSERQTPSTSKHAESKRSIEDVSHDKTEDASVVKIKLEVSEFEIYICSVCKSECEWEPTEIKNESITCDKCNCWFHYKCVHIKGNESFLKKESTSWFCCNCSRKGKGKGKGKGKK